jgi:hypothetical protein
MSVLCLPNYPFEIRYFIIDRYSILAEKSFLSVMFSKKKAEKHLFRYKKFNDQAIVDRT